MAQTQNEITKTQLQIMVELLNHLLKTKISPDVIQVISSWLDAYGTKQVADAIASSLVTIDYDSDRLDEMLQITYKKLEDNLDEII